MLLTFSEKACYRMQFIIFAAKCYRSTFLLTRHNLHARRFAANTSTIGYTTEHGALL